MRTIQAAISAVWEVGYLYTATCLRNIVNVDGHVDGTKNIYIGIGMGMCVGGQAQCLGLF